MNEKFMNVMLTVAAKIGNNRYLAAIRDAFTDLMPIIIVGSFCTLFSNVVCNTTPGYMSLANVPGLSWLGLFKPLFVAANYGTMNMMSIGVVILLSAKVAESFGNTDKVVSITALGSMLSLLNLVNWKFICQIVFHQILLDHLRYYSQRSLQFSLLRLLVSHLNYY